MSTASISSNVPSRSRTPLDWLRLWFLLVDPVNRRDYAISGFGLMAFKYAVEAGVVWVLTGLVYTPLDFVNPLITAREKFAHGAPDWFGFAWVIWALPFIWISVGMSIRRSLNAGISPWHGLWVLVPFVNLIVMLLLAVLPTSTTAQILFEEVPEHQARRAANVASTVSAAAGGVAAGAIYAFGMTLGAVYLFDSYGAAVFFGTPIVTGLVASYLLNRKVSRSYALSLTVAMVALLCFATGLLLFAFEGAICIAMVMPIVLPLGLLGAPVGKLLADLRRGAMHRHFAAVLLTLPAISAAESLLPPSNEFVVVSTVDITAPPETVWRNVVGFSEITERPEWMFRLGIACPTEAKIYGEGVGARRECIFSTGKFVEPITRWDAPQRLAFDVAEQPMPMLELTPYRHIHPPHLDIAFRTTRGEFELLPLPNGGTRLIGRTWYVLDIQPNAYWTVWSDWLVHRIHLRVLRHIKELSEKDGV